MNPESTWHCGATADTREIWQHVAAQTSIDTADRLLDAVDNKVDMLRRFPYAGRSRACIQEGLRSVEVKGYVVYYRIEPDRHVEVNRLIHGRRDQYETWAKYAPFGSPNYVPPSALTLHI
jgi:toxin ParE1/3/4